MVESPIIGHRYWVCVARAGGLAEPNEPWLGELRSPHGNTGQHYVVCPIDSRSNDVMESSNFASASVVNLYATKDEAQVAYVQACRTLAERLTETAKVWWRKALAGVNKVKDKELAATLAAD